jgi:transposase
MFSFYSSPVSLMGSVSDAISSGCSFRYVHARLQNFRRVATRFDYHAENYLGFVHLGCIKILLRCYL